MHVGNSGDVSLEGASFSECMAGEVRLPRPHTLASPAHARSHAIAAPEAGEEGRGTWVATGARFPQRALGLPTLSRSLMPSPPMPARPNSRSTEELCACPTAATSRWTAPALSVARVAHKRCRGPPPQEGAQTEAGEQTCSFVGSLSHCRRAPSSHQLAISRQHREPNPRCTLLQHPRRCHRLDPPQHVFPPQLCARRHHNPRGLASNVGLSARLLDAERRPDRRWPVRLQQKVCGGSLRQRVGPLYLRLQRPLLVWPFLPRGIGPPTEVPRRHPHAQQAGGEHFGLLPLRPRPIPARERPGGVPALHRGLILPQRRQRRLRSLPEGRRLRGRGRRLSPCLAALPCGQLQPEERLQLERGVRAVPHRHGERGARGGEQRDVRAL